MKILNLSLIMFLFMSVVSCSENSDDNTLLQEDPFDYVEDGTVISGIRWQSLEYGDYKANGFSSKEEYDESIKTLSDYDDILLYIQVNYDNWGFHFIDEEKDKILQTEIKSYLREKAKVLIDDSKNHSDVGDQRGFGRDQYFTAYINDGVEITCDKILFGLQPGENLLSKLMIMNNYTCQPIGIEPPYSIAHCDDVSESLGTTVFCNEAWLRFNYLLRFKEIPEEKYDELTFHLRFPFIKEYASHYISTSLKGYETQPRFEEVEYEGDVIVKFKY